MVNIFNGLKLNLCLMDGNDYLFRNNKFVKLFSL